MPERLKPFPAGYSPEVSPEWEAMAKRINRTFLRAVTRKIDIKGKENIPKDIKTSSYIIAVNHLGWAEALFLLDVFPKWIHWMSKQESFDHKLLGPIFRLLGFFPVRRGELDRRALQTAADLLGKERILGMAPEGTRGRGKEFGKLKEAKHGTIFVAFKTGAPIIPTAVWGTEELLPLIEENGLKLKDLTGFKPPEVHVRIGKPFAQHFEVDPGKVTRKQLKALTTNLMLEIRDLLPSKYHGFYAEAEKQPL